MASVYAFKTKKGAVRWQVLIRRKGEATISAKFDNWLEATKFGDDTESRLDKEAAARVGPSSNLPASGCLGDEELQRTINLYIHSPTCPDEHKQNLKSVLKHIGAVTNRQLTRAWIDGYTHHMLKTPTYRGTPYAYSSIAKHLIIVGVALKWRAGTLAMDPPKFHFSTKMFPDDWENERERRLEAPEEQLLMDHFDAMEANSNGLNDAPGKFWRLLVQLAIETGARLQELIKAEWRQFHGSEYRKAFWHIPRRNTKKKKHRVMALTRGAITALEELKGLADPDSKRLFHCWKTPASVSQRFHQIVEELRIEDFSFRDLRHEGISRFVLTQRNYTIFEIMKMVGHSDLKMTERYANLRGDELSAKLI